MRQALLCAQGGCQPITAGRSWGRAWVLGSLKCSHLPRCPSPAAMQLHPKGCPPPPAANIPPRLAPPRSPCAAAAVPFPIPTPDKRAQRERSLLQVGISHWTPSSCPAQSHRNIWAGSCAPPMLTPHPTTSPRQPRVGAREKKGI